MASEHTPDETLMPCGHGSRFVVSSGEGTSYCGECARIDRMKYALEKLRDCDWVATPHYRMDAVRDIARAALGESHNAKTQDR